MKHLHRFVRRAAAFVLAAVLCVCVLAPAASAAVTIGGADTTLIPAEEENCLAWLFGSSDTITMPYLNIKGQGLRRNVTLDLVDCLVGITYTELGSQRRPAGVEGAGGGHPFLSGIPQAVRLLVQCPHLHPGGSDPVLGTGGDPQGGGAGEERGAHL